uniref:Uncharacterized protein n=1 Tax=Panagrellus redivivus TaxID=6233 RepID=A0A7E4VER5_PANRE
MDVSNAQKPTMCRNNSSRTPKMIKSYNFAWCYDFRLFFGQFTRSQIFLSYYGAASDPRRGSGAARSETGARSKYSNKTEYTFGVRLDHFVYNFALTETDDNNDVIVEDVSNTERFLNLLKQL